MGREASGFAERLVSGFFLEKDQGGDDSMSTCGSEISIKAVRMADVPETVHEYVRAETTLQWGTGGRLWGLGVRQVMVE